MHLAQVYEASRERMTALAVDLTADQEALIVPATPLWTVADVYRHLTGLPGDILGGNLEGRGTPAWTAAQVATRAEDTLAEVCAEWAVSAPPFEALIAEQGFALARPCFDVWTHEQDVLGALGRAGDRADPALPTLVASLLALLRDGWAANPDRPPIEFVVDGASHHYGAGTPELVLRSTGYEFVRTVISRRSRAQLLAADWTGEDPERIFGALCRFDLPENDLAD